MKQEVYGNFNLDSVRHEMRYQKVDYPILDVEGLIESHKIDLNPDYQRDHVWTREQSIAYVGHVLEGGNPGLILINSYNNGRIGPYEVVDGKQRLTAIRMWVRNEIPAKLPFANVEVYREELDKKSVMACSLTITLEIGRMYYKTRKEVMEIYLRLNAGGSIHKPEELDRVRKMLAENKAKG